MSGRRVAVLGSAVEDQRASARDAIAYGAGRLAAENRLHDLRLFYQLLSRVKDGLKDLNVGFSAYIKV